MNLNFKSLVSYFYSRTSKYFNIELQSNTNENISSCMIRYYKWHAKGLVNYDNKINHCSLFQTTRELLVSKTDLQGLTLAWCTRPDPILDPLALLHLNNWLCMSPVSPVFYTVVTMNLLINSGQQNILTLISSFFG